MVAGGRVAGGLVSYFARHGTIANLLMVLMVAAGLFAADRMRAQYFPDVVISEVTVTVAWSGAGAEDVDAAIVQVLEPALLAVEGVQSTTARASEGSARITLEFEPGIDLTRATEEVQTAVDGIRTLPEAADPPEVRRVQWRDGVTDVVITGPVGIDQLARLGDDLVTRLFAAGVTRTTLQGLAAPQTVVEVRTVDLMRHDVTMSDIATAIAAAIRATPAGDVGDGAARVRTGEERRSARQISEIVLRSGTDGTALTIGDVALVRVDGADRGRAAFVGQNPAITLRVDRDAEGDAIGLQQTVGDVVAGMRDGLPKGVTIELVRARADQITERLELLIDNAVSGLLIVVGLLFLFLNARTALWVAAGIPVALLAGLAAMYAIGMTLNMISLFALIMMLGIVVDDAIVVGEHADFRARKLGEPAQIAAERGAGAMGAPVIASTLTTVIAFLGLTAIGGRFGDMIVDIPLVVTVVLLASLVEVFLILPNHMMHALAHVDAERWYDWPSRQVNRGMAWFQRRAMKPFVRFVIRARYPVLALCFLALASQAALVIRGDVPFRFFNGPEQSAVNGNFSMLPGATREDTKAMMAELQRAAEVVAARFEAEHGTNPVTFVLAEVGGGSGRGLSSAETKDADLLGALSVELINPDLRPYSTSAFLAALQEEVRPHPQLEELSFRGGRFGPGGDAISVDLSGQSAEGLKAAAEALKAALAPFPEVSALEDSLAYDKDELVLRLTPQGEALGFDIDSLGRALRDRLNGIEAATYPDGMRSAAIRVELAAAEQTADFLDRTMMRAGPNTYVPLADLVSATREAGFSTVRRENGLRVVTVSGDLSEDDPARAAEIQRQLREVIVPRVEADHGVTARFSGLAEQEREFLGDSVIALVMAIGGIFLCLAWIFESWTRPLVVMAVIPFSLVGAIYGHHAWDLPMSLFSIVGMIGMAGIIINDSIVLVSTIDEYSERRGLVPAIVDAVSDRLRPVLLTTLTTVLGLAPLLFERSSQAQFLKPTIVTLSYGLGFGMVLVLIVVPALAAVQADVGRTLQALRRGLWRDGPARGPLGLATALVGAGFLALLLPFVATGAAPGWLVAVIPALAALPPALATTGIFLIWTLLVCLAVLAATLRRQGARAA